MKRGIGIFCLFVLLALFRPQPVWAIDAASQTAMAAPPGYAHLIFDDKFAGTALDTSKWNVQMGDAHAFPWGNKGKLPNPYSAVSNTGVRDDGSLQYKAEYGNPDDIVVNNGLTISVRRDTSQPGYSWRGGYLCTEGKFKFQGGYVQIRARLPDSRTGGWAAFWFLDGGGEIDLNESGFTGVGDNVNKVMASKVFAPGNDQQLFDTGMDLSADYHVYGMRYIPGQSVTTYIDGRQLAHFTANIPTGAYEIIIANGIGQNTGHWHTLSSSATPEPLDLNVSEVQVWQP